MKKLLFALSLILLASAGINAQSCSKGAKKSCKSTCEKKTAQVESVSPDTQVAAAMSEAEMAAGNDENIEVRTCPMSGTKTFYQKSVNDSDGSVMWDQVEYNSENKSFTKVASASAEREVMDADGKKEMKSCSKDGDKKACCKKGESKSCCSGKDAKKCSKEGKKGSCSSKKADSTEE